MVEAPRARVQSMSSDPKGTEVQVEVVGPKMLPLATKEFRARARALVESGVLPAARSSVENITMGEIERLTMVRGKPMVESMGKVNEAALYTVVVES